jgi:putative ribosome biogenesis GTPase RsgA
MVFSFVSNNDYHEMIDIIAPKEYNCNQVERYLIGGWHPDIPKVVIEKCNKLKQEKYNVKTI